MRIETVRGPIDPAALGVTMTHEHTLVDLYPWRAGSDARVVPWGLPYDGIVDDEELLVEELGRYREAGGGAIVDVTNVGIGRNPLGLRRLSEATGLHIVMGSGWYREAVYPDFVIETPTNGLADHLVREIHEGVDDTGIRPGVIGEIGTERGFVSALQERVLRACARAARDTGLAVSTHTTHFGDLAESQISILREEGLPADRVVIGHVGSRRRDGKDLIDLLEAGVYVEIDHVGAPASGGMQNDPQRASNIAAAVRAGHGDRVLISMDTSGNSQLHWYGGRGFDHLLRTFVPLLHEAGLDESQVHAILVDNPARVLAW